MAQWLVPDIVHPVVQRSRELQRRCHVPLDRGALPGCLQRACDGRMCPGVELCVVAEQRVQRDVRLRDSDGVRGRCNLLVERSQQRVPEELRPCREAGDVPGPRRLLLEPSQRNVRSICVQQRLLQLQPPHGVPDGEVSVDRVWVCAAV